MRRLLVVMVAAVATVAAFAGPASGQVDQSTTTVADSTTTTADVPTTVVDTPTTTEAAPVTSTTIPQIDLPGEHVTAGDLHLGASFKTADASSCTMTGSVAGGEINIMKDEKGNIGAVYGKADLGAGQAGLVMVELGPLPIAIGAFRTMGTCNQDVVTVGSYTATPSSASLSSVGYGLYPKDFATSVDISLDVAGTEPTASLNLQGAYDFLAQKRPGS